MGTIQQITFIFKVTNSSEAERFSSNEVLSLHQGQHTDWLKNLIQRQIKEAHKSLSIHSLLSCLRSSGCQMEVMTESKQKSTTAVRIYLLKLSYVSL